MEAQSPSQEAFSAMTKAESFHGFPGGDTQPMDTQVYRDYSKSMVHEEPAEETPVQASKQEHDHFNYGMTLTERTPHTYAEGDTGYVNLAQEWQREFPTVQSQGSDDMDDLLENSPPTEFQVPDIPHNASMPDTPSMAGNKHDRKGNILTSAPTTGKKTPGFSQLFGGDAGRGPMLSATQLFDQTQAPSSPIHDAPRSDPVISRPSPNLHQNFNMSSPSAFTTSPFATMHSRLSASAREPRDTYTSVRKSQEKKFARLRQESSILEGLESENEEEDVTKDSIRLNYERKRARKLLNDQARDDLKKVGAPSRPGSRLSANRQPAAKIEIDLVTPAPNPGEKDSDFTIASSDGESEEGQIGDEDACAFIEDHEEHVVAEDDGSVDDQDDDDVYDELGQAVLRSQGSMGEDIAQEHDGTDIELGITRNDLDSRSNQHEGNTTLPADETAGASSRVINTQQSAIIASQTGHQNPQDLALTRHRPVPSPRSSFLVPGSQYAAKTNEKQTQYPHQSLNTIEAVPSSPPIPNGSEFLQNISLHARREASSPFQRQYRSNSADMTRHEIPESDLPELAHASPGSGQPEVQAESYSMLPFSTARTHISMVPPSQRGTTSLNSPVKLLASQQDRMISPSPRRAAGVRHFADIANEEPSQSRGSAETDLNLEEILSDVITTEDKEFMRVVGSPKVAQTRTLRKIKHSKSNATGPESISEETAPPGPPTLVNAVGQETSSHNAQGSRGVQPEEAKQSTIDLPQQAVEAGTDKANELLNAFPGAIPSPSGTPESAKGREAAGAQAVIKLVSSYRPKRLSNATNPTDRRATTTNSTGRIAKPAPKTLKLKLKTYTAKVTAKPYTRNFSQNTSAAEDDIEPQKSEARDALGKAAPDDLALIAPHRLFAFFNGSQSKYNNYYPATWVSTRADGDSFEVRFDDGTVRSVKVDQVCSLILRVGDTVNELHEGGHAQACVVQGFGCVAQTEAESALGTDQFGRATLKVHAKPAGLRNSTSAIASDELKDVEVLLTNVYLTRRMWLRFKDRTFAPPASGRAVADRAETSSTAVQTPDADTPTSRSRRPGHGIMGVMGIMGASRLREESVASSVSRSSAGIFSDMAFTLSFGSENDAEKKSITRHIQRNGGLLLEDGFDELFDLPDFEGMSSTTSRKSGKQDIFQDALQLKPQFQHLGFVVVISNNFNRRVKYIQALSLGLPTLSARWIHDSVDPAKNPSLSSTDATSLDWGKYLLAAGKSSYLGDAICSRRIPTYPVHAAKLLKTISQRENLLNHAGALLVIPKKETHKRFPFLTLALGAGHAQRVNDLAEARALLLKNPTAWKWVYVDGDVIGHVVEAKWELNGRKGTKPKARGKGAEGILSARTADGVMVVGDEFVIQSLILGTLVD